METQKLKTPEGKAPTRVTRVDQTKTYKFKASQSMTAYDVARLIEFIDLRVDSTAFKRLPEDLKQRFHEESNEG